MMFRVSISVRFDCEPQTAESLARFIRGRLSEGSFVDVHEVEFCPDEPEDDAND